LWTGSKHIPHFGRGQEPEPSQVPQITLSQAAETVEEFIRPLLSRETRDVKPA
jgi:hypothetical protein